MTIFFPDVSNHQPGMSIAGAVACIAKVSEGTTFKDGWYTWFRGQARAAGIPFCAYHWLHAADVPGQARNAFAMVGPDTPLMIDDEDTNDGLDIGRTLAFVREYRALGGTVTLEYLPRWFWAAHGSPDLRPLAAAGLSLVSSNYTAYSDTGPGWAPYGGVAPAIWQYTSSAPFNGVARVDFNAFRGSVDELAALFNGGNDMTPEQARQLHNLDRLHTALLLDADEVTGLDDGAGNVVSYPLAIVRRQKRIDAALAALTGPVSVDVAALKAEFRDAVADLGEGGAAQVRADADA